MSVFPGAEEVRSPAAGTAAPLGARPQLIRAMNERLLADHVRASGPISRTDLARIAGLSKPTVALALSNLERDGLLRAAGVRTGVRGPAAVLYEVRPEAGYVLGLDVGRAFLRGALMDLSGTVLSRRSRKVGAASAHGRVAELTALGDELVGEAGIARRDITQTVVGSPGVYDPGRAALTMARNLPGWESPTVVSELQEVFGATTVVENDVDLAALAEARHGHGREVANFCVVWVGTGVGMGVVIDGRLHRGAHGAAGEIGYLPIGAPGVSALEARRHGELEAAAAAAGVVRAAKAVGLGGPLTARRVFAAAEGGDEQARQVVREEARLVARAVLAVVAVVDPELVILGGGIGQAPGFAEVVGRELDKIAPFGPRLVASALGDEAVVQGCLAAGAELAWARVVERASR